METQKHVLCVEDDEDNSILLMFMLEDAGYKVTLCKTGEDCLQHFPDHRFSAVVLDHRLPDKDGLEICREIRKADSRTPIILFTGDGRQGMAEIARQAGVNAYLIKPNDLESLIPTLNGLIAHQ